jgi:predicted transcriptional regulator
MPADRGKKAPAAKSRKPVLVYLDPDLAKNLKLAAVQRETSASAIAGEAIAAWLKSRGLLASRERRS